MKPEGCEEACFESARLIQELSEQCSCDIRRNPLRRRGRRNPRRRNPRYRRNARRRLPRRFREERHIREEIEEGIHRQMSFGILRKLVIDYYKEIRGQIDGIDIVDSFKHELQLAGWGSDPLSPHEAVMADYQFYLLHENSRRAYREKRQALERPVFTARVEADRLAGLRGRPAPHKALPNSTYVYRLASNFLRLSRMKKLQEAAPAPVVTQLLGVLGEPGDQRAFDFHSRLSARAWSERFTPAEYITDYPLSNKNLGWARSIFTKLIKFKFTTEKTHYSYSDLLLVVLWMSRHRSFRLSPIWVLKEWAKWILYRASHLLVGPYSSGETPGTFAYDLLGGDKAGNPGQPLRTWPALFISALKDIRPGSPATVAAAARGWKYDITLPKKIAVTFSKMSDSGKFMAHLAWLRVKARLGLLGARGCKTVAQITLLPPAYLGSPGLRRSSSALGGWFYTAVELGLGDEEGRNLAEGLTWREGPSPPRRSRASTSMEIDYYQEFKYVRGLPRYKVVIEYMDLVWKQSFQHPDPSLRWASIGENLGPQSQLSTREKKERGKIYRRALSFFYHGRLPEVDLRALYWILQEYPEALTQTHFPFKAIIKLNKLFRQEAGLEAVLSNKESIDLASKLYRVFKKRYPEWLRAARSKDVPSPLHDATYWLPARNDIPDIEAGVDPNYIDSLREFLLKHKYRQNSTLAAIASRWIDLNAEERKLSLLEIQQVLASKVYTSVHSNRFAFYANKAGVSKTNYPIIESAWLRSLDIPSPFPLERFWKHKDLIGRFIPRSDPRGLFLGYLTDCCQYPGSMGGSSAWAGQVLPNCGFFIVHSSSKGKEEEIIAQSWVWLSKEIASPGLGRAGRGLCFDNIEGKSIGDRIGVLDLYKKVAADLVPHFGFITVGEGYSKVGLQGLPPVTLKSPGYLRGAYLADSQSQRLLAPIGPKESSSPFRHDWISAMLLVTEPKEIMDIWVRPVVGSEYSDRSKLELIASLAYHAPSLRYVPESEVGYILETYSGQPAGFTLLDVKKRQIDELAIIPKFRSLKNLRMLWGSIIKEMKARGPEPWGAEVREATSYRAIKALAKRGIIKFKEISRELRSADEPSPTDPSALARPRTTADVWFITIEFWLL